MHSRAAITAALLAASLLCACGESAPRRHAKAELAPIAEKYREGEFEAAIVDLRKHLKTWPRDDMAWTILGNALLDTAQEAKAEEAYEAALSINPKRFEAITSKGIIHRKRGEYDEAMAAYKRALEIKPSYAQAYSSMTVIALKQGNDEEALDHAKRGFGLDAKDPVIVANFAVACHYNGDEKTRDKMTALAEKLGYRKIDTLRQIYAGDLTVRD